MCLGEAVEIFKYFTQEDLIKLSGGNKQGPKLISAYLEILKIFLVSFPDLFDLTDKDA